jgi:hypothetical protein
MMLIFLDSRQSYPEKFKTVLSYWPHFGDQDLRSCTGFYVFCSDESSRCLNRRRTNLFWLAAY